MAPKREREETELKVPKSLPISICTPPQKIPAPPPQLPAPMSLTDKLSEQRPSSTACSPQKHDLVCRGTKRLSRCSGSGCRKIIGLMGFRCRCGDLFCGEHRYSDRHDCSYDYKAAGRAAIARENPVVRAAKLVTV
ncbi:hypothetical protein ACS0TY_030284 [Phlomoides rotata]